MAVIPPSTRTYSSKFKAIQDNFSYSKRTVLQYEITTRCFTRRSLSDDVSTRTKMIKCTKLSHWNTLNNKGVLSPVYCASQSSDDFGARHQKALETYLESLQRQVEPTTSKTESDESRKVVEANKGLQSLERYISILKEDAKSEECLPSTIGRNRSRMSENSAVGYMNVAKQKTVYARKSNSSSSLFDVKADGSNLYLISILISINIAVFLFEIASPIKNADSNLWSLPLMYGAKVNDLIMVGEWWRLVTPMFLHAGLLHIALNSWVLLSFGPQVCKGYGAFTFFLIFILGGISGNFTSFLHTSEPTVGGSGPVFAVIGSWLIYQAQNKDVYGKENTDSMFQKAIIATASSFVLANFDPIDNWTSLGAAISGIIYGFLTSQVIQIDDASGPSVENRIKEEMTLSKRTTNHWKSLMIFTLFVSVFSFLLLFVESPLN